VDGGAPPPKWKRRPANVNRRRGAMRSLFTVKRDPRARERNFWIWGRRRQSAHPFAYSSGFARAVFSSANRVQGQGAIVRKAKALATRGAFSCCWPVCGYHNHRQLGDQAPIRRSYHRHSRLHQQGRRKYKVETVTYNRQWYESFVSRHQLSHR